MTGLSRAAVERILKKSGAGRVSADATTTLVTLMEEYGTFLFKGSKKDVRPYRKENGERLWHQISG